MTMPPNIVTRSESSCSGVSDSKRETSASLAATLCEACSSGDRAFHLSQIRWLSSCAGGSPPRPAVTKSSKISAPLPRWDSTSAIDHSVA